MVSEGKKFIHYQQTSAREFLQSKQEHGLGKYLAGLQSRRDICQYLRCKVSTLTAQKLQWSQMRFLAKKVKLRISEKASKNERNFPISSQVAK